MTDDNSAAPGERTLHEHYQVAEEKLLLAAQNKRFKLHDELTAQKKHFDPSGLPILPPPIFRRRQQKDEQAQRLEKKIDLLVEKLETMETKLDRMETKIGFLFNR